MNNIFPIFEFLKDKSEAGLGCALVTLTAVTGASTRNPGAHMAVAADGSAVGSFSGGCIETAVVAEAVDCISANAPREVRFGAGSPYLDIRLPCGGGIDLLFTPLPDARVAADLFQAVTERQPFTISMDRETGALTSAPAEQDQAVVSSGSLVHVNHIPAAKIIILGHGAVVENLANLTASYGLDCKILTPDADIVQSADKQGVKASLLKTPAATNLYRADPWTACVFYFHDHDWEAELMKQALASPAFYVGAMGSFKTHDTRKVLLSDIGVSEDDIKRMKAPIGIIPSTRDPATLALSTLTEIIETYHSRFSRTHGNIAL
ncbi:MAG: XdhC family protein [Parasphingorhabdus sp.]|uniref:XdhC family protein n=1 Tax=Parasphingorhabdus sp. TaxID=2709688 RepID=UPI00329963B1